MIIIVVVSTNLPCFIQFMCVLGSNNYELYPMEEKMFNDFLIDNGKRIIHVIKVYLFHDLYFVYVVEAFITLNCKLSKYMNPFF